MAKPTAPKRNASQTGRIRGNGGPPRVLGEQGERTRARLLEAARKVFRERTYPETRVDDITREAGTSHGAFYLYFNNKTEVLEALAAETSIELDELASRFAGIERGEAGFEQLRNWIDSFVDAYEANSPVIIALMMARPQEERFDRLGREMMNTFAGQISKTIREATAGGKHQVQSGIAATALVAMLERICYYWLVRGAEFDRAEFVDTLAAIWHRGIFGESHV
ncbi:MAG: TetR/AcrR family transcriptional regulator [Actinomycetota bacterium]|nr:TetR/AcrR family transcriptional regulator [Actinomycetota bacterium]